MPYVLVSTLVRLEAGPTLVGDESSDPELMSQIGAKQRHMIGNPFKEYYVEEPARVVLDKFETLGYKVVTMAGIGQTCVWTLHKPLSLV